MWQLREVDLNVTKRCNLSCTFCSVDVKRVSDRSAELSLKAIENLFHEFEQLGVSHVRIVGGEPFVRRDIHEILSLAGQFRFRSAVLTNGTLIKPQHIDLMKHCGLSHIAF